LRTQTRPELNSIFSLLIALPIYISPALWQACYKLACTQGVMALAWEGIQTLPACLQPPKALKLNWAMAVEYYEKRYRRYCHTIADWKSTRLNSSQVSISYAVFCY